MHRSEILATAAVSLASLFTPMALRMGESNVGGNRQRLIFGKPVPGEMGEHPRLVADIPFELG